jgi:hypothetical protein
MTTISKFVTALALAATTFVAPAMGGEAQNLQHLATMATTLGYASACDTPGYEKLADRMDVWLNLNWKPGSQKHQEMKMAAVMAAVLAGDQQRAGKTNTTCDEVAKVVAMMLGHGPH